MDQIIDHWPFAAVALILATLGQVTTRTLFSDAMVKRHRLSAIGRATLPMHPVIAGALLGACKLPISIAVDSTQGSVLYFAFAGVASTWAYAVVRGVLKSRGIPVALPGESIPAPGKDSADA